jgi:phage terminase Nu1 subunit (DNA packaging protein)
MTKSAEAARHIDLSERRFRELLDAGVIERQRSDGYDLLRVRTSYIRHLRSALAGHGSANLTVQRARLADAQAQRAEFQNALSQGGFVQLSLMERALARTLIAFREQCLSLPGKVADSCAGKDRGEIYDLIKTEVFEMLTALADPEGMVALAARGPSKGK